MNLRARQGGGPWRGQAKEQASTALPGPVCLESTFIDQNGPTRQTAGRPEHGPPAPHSGSPKGPGRRALQARAARENHRHHARGGELEGDLNHAAIRHEYKDKNGGKELDRYCDTRFGTCCIMCECHEPAGLDRLSGAMLDSESVREHPLRQTNLKPTWPCQWTSSKAHLLAQDSTTVRSWLYSPVSYLRIIVSLGCRPAERGMPPL